MVAQYNYLSSPSLTPSPPADGNGRRKHSEPLRSKPMNSKPGLFALQYYSETKQVQISKWMHGNFHYPSASF